MPEITIRIPDGQYAPDGSIECGADESGNCMYVDTEDQPDRVHGAMIGRVRIELVGV